MPDATVIIAAWNAVAHIARAVESALAQADIEVEVVVVDDASTDLTADLVAGYVDHRVKLVRSERNLGPGGARNLGLREAKGRWISVLDADDYMLPGRLAGLIASAERAGADIVADNFWIEPASAPDGRRLKFREPLDGSMEPVCLEDLFGDRLFGRSRGFGYLKPVFRAAFVGTYDITYDETLRIGEDLMFVACALAEGAKYLRKRQADYVYVTHDGSISHRLASSQVRAMALADQRFLQDRGARLTKRQRDSVKAHLGDLRDGEAFVAAVERLKARNVQGALSSLVRQPLAARHFRLPAIAALERGWQRLAVRRAEV
jgi:succinoglycan biosynthesis protein ExoO